MTELQRIVDQLNRAYYREAWHGPTVTEVLDGVTPEQAAARPIGQAHSIWEIVLHMTAWKVAVQKRALGQIIDLSPTDDWPAVVETNKAAWLATLDSLKTAHEALMATAEGLTEQQLFAIPSGRKNDAYFQITGVLQHDAYHAGQIAVLKKLL
ncbi:MAG: DinB family protein [candidate division Zixibacteria bacterium]|nr:DinB family protein [candidate division Zixibacteria bacterium]